MRELSDKECDVIIDEARDGCNDGFVRLSYVYVRAGYAAGYRAAQAAMPPREHTQAMIDAGEKRRREIAGRGLCISTIWHAMYDAWIQEQNGVQRHEASAGCALGASSLESGNAREATCLSGDPDARQPVAYTAGTVRDHAGSTPAAPTDPIADLCAELRATHCSNENLHDTAADALERLALERDKARHSDAHTLAVLKSAERDYLTRIAELRERAERAEAERDALRADAERYRFWRKFYDCRFALKLGTITDPLRAAGYAPNVGLSFMPTRPQVEIAKDYETLVDAAIDAARAKVKP